eukprot:TRINITY_DN3931_c0_g2_i1.p1 TRINITY_DN3931_c0_g2~~TRINITY_DN3931_c0_g2_i1.p1  ORF type:complete len:1617 (+),score=367.48 TRINITY_DN3931_c0_g2_i1:65-4915(+)
MSDTYNMKRSIVANVPIVATISLCLLVSLTQGADPLSTNFLDIEGPTICAAKPTCGNGKVESIGLPYTNRPESEECDDGNTINDDGCSSTCNLETQCGNGKREAGEGCDDGKRGSWPGCNSACQVVCGYTCTEDATTGLSTCSKTVAESCGNHIIEANEECDDGNQSNGDGCDSKCRVEPGWFCPSSSTSATCSSCVPRCGDNLMVGNEQCDDGDRSSRDGCSSSCQVECGFKCERKFTGTSTSIDFRTRCPSVSAGYERSVCNDTCGDGIKSTREECDDGNLIKGDGCDDRCREERNWDCSTNGCGRSTCVDKCGSGYITGNEECDDGNTRRSDGCSRDCKVETGWRCVPSMTFPNGTRYMSVCSRTCGDGVRHDSEQCDDGNTVSGDGCSSLCTVEGTHDCRDQVYPDSHRRSSCRDKCGNGIREFWEECDAGAGRGCDDNCRVECGFECKDTAALGGKVTSVCASVCGDGVKASDEACDDGNTLSGDGCSSTCTIDLPNGGSCKELRTGQRELLSGDYCVKSICESCGDAKTTGSEGCDDGNRNKNDGCTDCTVDCGWSCTTSSPNGIAACTAVRCGDGIRAGSERCDDGNKVDGDGCESDCTPTPNYTCDDPTKCGPSVCTLDCGTSTSKKEGGKECDDGNKNSGDGCSSTCKVECGFKCTEDSALRSTCTSTCGDGVKAADEQCDDGNKVDGDGCSSTCTAETGYTCTHSASTCGPSTCNPNCGTGKMGPGKTCDDGNNVSGDGCSSTCQIECGYECTIDSAGKSTCTTTCGDGVLTISTETCDDGNKVSGDGCSASCTPEAGFACESSFKDVTFTAPAAYGGSTFTRRCPASNCLASCNGRPVQKKECDDGKYNNGCSTTCEILCGFSCTGNIDDKASVCTSTCGDGIQARDEECDDGNVIPGDGCSATCQREPKWDCQSNPCGRTQCVDGCGSGFKNRTEGCDDGNRNCVDGCSGTCQVECGYTCTEDAAGLSVCVSRCGDGVLALGSEECDDGNTDAGDGCSPSCTIERVTLSSGVTLLPTHNCTTSSCGRTQCNSYCGNKHIDSTAEACDDGDVNDGDGCSSQCKVECGYTCTPVTTDGVTLSVCSAARCGDGVRAGNEECDDGNTNDNDGCSSTCKVDPQYVCGTPDNNRCATQVCVPRCGSGVKTGNEECDDSNTRSNDGCDSQCKVECGYKCTEASATSRSECTTTCGDGIVAGVEQCDDGNKVDGDGCSSACFTEDSSTCTRPVCGPSVCTPRCGNREVQTGEQCDDGDTNSGDGCSSTCTTECGYKCPATGGVCTAIACGDGIVALGDEECDDGNTVSGDGCSSQCKIESFHFTCDSTTPCQASTCTPTCGSGSRHGTEECDDGNRLGYDGCDYNCKVECGYKCTHADGAIGKSTCVSTCGDGIRAIGESCDDGNTVDGDGCSSQCLEEGGYWCTHTKCGASVCTKNSCGDGLIWPMTEKCDPGCPDCDPGCSQCLAEDTSKYACEKATCGDSINSGGRKGSNEVCDDGNTRDGDACSATCTQVTQIANQNAGAAPGATVGGASSSSSGLKTGYIILIVIAVIVVVVIIVVVAVVVMKGGKGKGKDADKTDAVAPGQPPPLETKVTEVQGSETPGKPSGESK